MSPTLREGKIIFARTFYGELNPHDIVIVNHGGIEKIKRIQKITAEHVYIVGDNPAQSTDSREFGWIARDRVSAKLLWPSR